MSLTKICTALFVVLSFVACEPQESKTDQTQKHIATANKNLDRMEALERELGSMDIHVDDPDTALLILKFIASGGAATPPPDLEKIKILLDDYVVLAQENLTIAERNDVSFKGRKDLQSRLQKVETILVFFKDRPTLKK